MLSACLLPLPFVLETIYTAVKSYDQRHFLIANHYIFLCFSAVLLGVVLALHAYAYIHSGMKKRWAGMVCVLLAATAVFGTLRLLDSGAAACLVCVFVLLETVLLPKIPNKT